MKRGNFWRTGACIAAGAAVLGLVNVRGSQPAGAADFPDLVVTQAASDGPGGGKTTITIKIRNVGTATAQSILFTLQGLIGGTDVHQGIVFLTDSLANVCASQGRPPGVDFQLGCYITGGALAPGATFTKSFAYPGQSGATLQSVVSAGTATGDLNLANNYSSLSTYIGPAAELQVLQLLPATTVSGTRNVTDVITNNGPWTATSLQLVVQIRAATFNLISATATPTSSCQTIPPAADYDAAVACVLNSLPPNRNWTVKFTAHGSPGGGYVQKATVTSLVPDPVATNNSKTNRTAFVR